jgi:hypothetical protein
LVISFLFLSRINEQSAHHMSIVLVVFSSDWTKYCIVG